MSLPNWLFNLGLDGGAVSAPAVSSPTYTYNVHTAFANPVLDTDVLKLAFHRSWASPWDGARAGKATVILDNTFGHYSPNNPNSSYANLLTTNQSLSIDAVSNTGSVYTLFTGYVDQFSVDPVVGKRLMVMTASDRNKELYLRKINLPTYINTKASSLVAAVLDSAGITSADQAISALNDDITYASFDDKRALTALLEIAKFGNYIFFSGRDGAINVKSRYFGLDGTIVGSYVNEFNGLSYALNDNKVYNKVKVEGQPLKQATSVQTVAWLENVESIPASGSTGFWLNFVDPENREQAIMVNSAVTPVSSTDYRLNTAVDGGGTDLTATSSLQITFFGRSAVCSLFNGTGTDGYITQFQIKGKPLTRQPKIRVEAEDSSSVARYGEKRFTLSSELINNLNYARDYAEFIKIEKNEPSADISFGLKNQYPDILSRDIGDIVHLVESNTAVGSNWFISGMDHTIALTRGTEHSVKYNVTYWRDRKYLIADHVVYGKIGTDRVLAF